MSKLISGKDALIALANGEEVLYISSAYEGKPNSSWSNAKEVEVKDFLNEAWAFKLKPRTITLNGIEVPAPFKPKYGDIYFIVHPAAMTNGYTEFLFGDGDFHNGLTQFGAWRTEEEIKRVVAALRQVFRG